MATNSVLAKLGILISANTAELGKALSQSQSQLKSFQNTVRQIGNAIGVSLGTAALFQGIKQVVGIMSEFEAIMSQVRGITGATGDEFRSLERDALRLGAATKFTASEVGQLQVAFGRLGFNTKEILDATEATLALAAATGEDLAKSADVAGSTVRGFGLQAKDTQRVVDVMAKSFNTTALGLDNFTEAMKYVAPIAAAANVSVEETTALLGVLADAGIRGSSAGTALRKIFSDLSKDGRPFAERLEELSNKGITLKDSFDEVGRTAQTALLVLSKNKDKADELTASFQNVAGEAEKMARIMQDNLQGDVEKLISAWEGLILSLSNTKGLRTATQGLTALFNALSGTPDIDEGLRQLIVSIKNNSEPAIAEFVKVLGGIRQELGKPIDTSIVNELAEKYDLTSEQANKLFSSLLEVNRALSFQEKAIQQFNDFAERNGYDDLSKAADDYKQRLYNLILAEQQQQQQLKESIFNADSEKIFGPAIQKSQEQVAAYRRVIAIINEYSSTFKKSEAEVQAATAKTIVNLRSYRDVLKSLNDEFEQVEIGVRGFSAATSSNLRVIASEIAATEGLIESVERLKESFKDFEVNVKSPDLSALLNPTNTVSKTEGGLTFDLDQTLTDAMTERFEKRLEKSAQATVKATNTMKGAFISLGPSIANGISGLADALGQAAAGVGNFGQDILRVVAGFARQLGEILIATGTAMLVAKKALISNPYLAIAAGIALVALAGAASASINKAHAKSFGGGSVGSTGAENVSRTGTPRPIQIELGGKFIVAGRDMQVVLSNQNIRSQRTG